MKVDLHNHSIYSDGLYSIEELLKIAKDNKVLFILFCNCFNKYFDREACRQYLSCIYQKIIKQNCLHLKFIRLRAIILVFLKEYALISIKNKDKWA